MIPNMDSVSLVSLEHRACPEEQQSTQVKILPYYCMMDVKY